MVTILVIDDKEEIRLKLQLLLQKAGYSTETVAGPSHAKILMRSTTFDVLLVDLNDPFESRKGQESLSFFKALAGMPAQPILIPMTAWPSGELMQQIQNMGISNFVEKPVKTARVLQVIQQEMRLQSIEALNQNLTAQLEKLGRKQIPMMTLEEAEIQLIQQALVASEHNVMKAAKLLGLTKSSLYRRLEKYGLSRPSELSAAATNQTQH